MPSEANFESFQVSVQVCNWQPEENEAYRGDKPYSFCLELFMNLLRPSGITADRGKSEVTITWNDDHVSRYPFSWLREACPCAECRGGHENMGVIPEPDLFIIPLQDARETQIQDIQAMGNYAISITWMDGHQHGIYNWAYLRAICPCEECQAKKGE